MWNNASSNAAAADQNSLSKLVPQVTVKKRLFCVYVLKLASGFSPCSVGECMMYAGSELTAFFAVLGLAGPDKLFLESLFLRFGRLLQHPGSSFAAPLATRSTSCTIFQ